MPFPHRTSHAHPLPIGSMSVPCVAKSQTKWLQASKGMTPDAGMHRWMTVAILDGIYEGTTCWPWNGSSHGYFCRSSHSQASRTFSPDLQRYITQTPRTSVSITSGGSREKHKHKVPECQTNLIVMLDKLLVHRSRRAFPGRARHAL
jgi:hypothetical protein